MQRCPNCSRHIWESERRCPFCSVVCNAQASAPALVSALVGLALCACGGDGEDSNGSTSSDSMNASTGMNSMSSTNGQSSSEAMSSSDPTTMEDPTTTTLGSTSTTASSSSASDSTTSSSTSDTGETTMDPDTGTTAETTTEGECLDPELPDLCGDVCTNTQWDSLNCGMCFLECPDDESCSEGECMIILLPYGAPMPEPLWV